MKHLAAFLLIAGLLGLAAPAYASDPNDYYACTRHIPAAEKAYDIPRGILHSVALTESGYAGWPWPWTLNIDGKGIHIPTREQALKLMKNPDGGLHREMAVGCMQIFVRFHGDKFASASQMIEPRNNVWYAASYLRELYGQYGSWTEAVARYYSSKKVHQIEYLCSVVGKRISLGYQTKTLWFSQQCEKDRLVRSADASNTAGR